MSAKLQSAKIKIESNQAAGGAKKQQKPNIQIASKSCSINETSQNISNRNKPQVVAKMQVKRPQPNQIAKNNNNKYKAVRTVTHIELVPQSAEAQELHAEGNREANFRNEAAREAANFEIDDDSNRRLPIIVEKEEQREEVVNINKNTTLNLICSSKNVGNSNFRCHICDGNVRNAVITICGHLYCWPCLWAFERPRLDCTCCPLCKRVVQMHEDVVPYFGGIDGEDGDIANATAIEGGDVVTRPSAFRVKTTSQGCPWFLTESLVARGINTTIRRKQHNGTNRFNGNTLLARVYDLLINIEICLVFLIILALKFL